MAPQNPLTRLRQVALGLDALARELEELLGEPPANLRWWESEILDVVVELEAAREATVARPTASDAPSASTR